MKTRQSIPAAAARAHPVPLIAVSHGSALARSLSFGSGGGLENYCGPVSSVHATGSWQTMCRKGV